jgi:hypothetical protein
MVIKDVPRDTESPHLLGRETQKEVIKDVPRDTEAPHLEHPVHSADSTT